MRVYPVLYQETCAGDVGSDCPRLAALVFVGCSALFNDIEVPFARNILSSLVLRGSVIICLPKIEKSLMEDVFLILYSHS